MEPNAAVIRPSLTGMVTMQLPERISSAQQRYPRFCMRNPCTILLSPTIIRIPVDSQFPLEGTSHPHPQLHVHRITLSQFIYPHIQARVVAFTLYLSIPSASYLEHSHLFFGFCGTAHRCPSRRAYVRYRSNLLLVPCPALLVLL